MAQDYSDWLKQTTDIGVANLVSSVNAGDPAKFDPGLLYSNGVRYSLFRFKAANVAACSFAGTTGNTYISAYVGDDANLPT